MSDTPPKPEPGSKQSRIEAAEGRVAFWKIWSEEFDDPTAVAYFQSRLNHWLNYIKSIDLEP